MRLYVGYVYRPLGVHREKADLLGGRGVVELSVRAAGTRED